MGSMIASIDVIVSLLIILVHCISSKVNNTCNCICSASYSLHINLIALLKLSAICDIELDYDGPFGH